jgi:cobalt-zinc-cadmium efflux system outer membrane protein
VAPSQDLIARALASRSEIALIRARRSIFTQQGRLAKAEGIPDLTPHYRMPSVTREPRDGGFGIGISIPLIDYGSRRNRVRQASASAKAEEMRLVDAENAVRRDVTAAYEKLTASKLVVESFRSGILDDAKRLLDATLTGFRLGGSTILEVLEAQRTYRAVQSDYIAALADHAEALALLERAVGGVPAEWLLAEKKN